MLENKQLFQWNIMYNYIIDSWRKMDQTKTFKEQFNDDNVNITEVNNINHFILIKYNMYNCEDLYKNENSIYREARSLVIDLNKEEIVLCPFRKFFNINELEETSIENVKELIKKADLIEFSNKYDGSMQQARWYYNQLIYSGSSALDENTSIQLKEGKKLFTYKYQQLCKDYNDYTFIFEAILEDIDPHVVCYKHNELILIGARNVYTGKTLTYSQIILLGKKYQIPYVKIDDIDLNYCLTNEKNFKASEKEGWVIDIRIHDKEYRYKFKCSEYVQIHSLINEINSSNVLIQAIADNKIDDLISKVPLAYKERIIKKISYINNFVKIKQKMINDSFNKVKHLHNKKDFSLLVQKEIDKDLQPYMYMLFNNKSFNLLKNHNKSYIKQTDIEKFFKEKNI